MLVHFVSYGRIEVPMFSYHKRSCGHQLWSKTTSGIHLIGQLGVYIRFYMKFPIGRYLTTVYSDIKSCFLQLEGTFFINCGRVRNLEPQIGLPWDFPSFIKEGLKLLSLLYMYI